MGSCLQNGGSLAQEVTACRAQTIGHGQTREKSWITMQCVRGEPLNDPNHSHVMQMKPASDDS